MANPATVKKMAADEFLEWEQGQPGKHEFIAGEIFSWWARRGSMQRSPEMFSPRYCSISAANPVVPIWRT